jgi:hypothetical protein
MKINYSGWIQAVSGCAHLVRNGGCRNRSRSPPRPDTVTYQSQLAPTPRTQRQTAVAPDPNLAPSASDAKVQSSSQ